MIQNKGKTYNCEMLVCVSKTQTQLETTTTIQYFLLSACVCEWLKKWFLFWNYAWNSLSVSLENISSCRRTKDSFLLLLQIQSKMSTPKYEQTSSLLCFYSNTPGINGLRQLIRTKQSKRL